MDQATEDWSPHSAHWGAFSARWNGATLDVRPYEDDPAPSSILQNFTTAMRHKARILRPMVRKAWLDRSKTAERDFDQTFVACPSVVLRDGDTNSGATEVFQPWSEAVAEG